MSEYITVSFPPKEEPLLKRVKTTKPKAITLAEHARNLMRDALDATVAKPSRAKK